MKGKACSTGVFSRKKVEDETTDGGGGEASSTKRDFQNLENVIAKLRCSTAVLTTTQSDDDILEKKIALYIVEKFEILPLDESQPLQSFKKNL